MEKGVCGGGVEGECGDIEGEERTERIKDIS